MKYEEGEDILRKGEEHIMKVEVGTNPGEDDKKEWKKEQIRMPYMCENIMIKLSPFHVNQKFNR